MDQEQKPPSFLDDPDLDAQLAALDQGLRRLAAQGGEVPPPAPSRAAFPSADAPPAGPPRAIFPESAFTRTPPASRFARESASAPVDHPAPASETVRPLLDLFPPPPIPDRQTTSWPGPASGDAPPPRAVRSHFGERVELAAAPATPSTYESFYGLAEKPFTLSTDPKFIYHSASHDSTMAALVGAIGRREAVTVLTGAPGTGKTTLCRSLLEQLDRGTTACFVTEPLTSFEDLMKVALLDFGVIGRDEATRSRVAVATRQELMTAIGDFSASLVPAQAAALIVIDDAQNVPADVLEPLAAVAEDAGRRIQILLVGTPALLSRLADAKLGSLQRLVAARSRLAPLTTDETAGYVVHRLVVAGVTPRVEFSATALSALHEIADGVPRVINLVCDRALALGFAASTNVIDDQLITAAAADLDLVPLEGDPPSALRRTVIVLVVLASLLAGAGAAAWLFRADLSRLMQQTGRP